MIYLDHNIIDFAISKHSLLACFVLYILVHSAVSEVHMYIHALEHTSTWLSDELSSLVDFSLFNFNFATIFVSCKKQSFYKKY